MKSKLLAAAWYCALAFAFVLGQALTPRAQAQTFKVVYNFTGASDGGNPLDGLTSDGAGNLYGTTYAGGASSSGTVFKLSGSSETVVHNFAGGTDGANPEGGLLRDAQGFFFGTTTAGGASGAGTVFAISAAGKEVVLYSFAGGADGSNPQAGLAMDSSGNLYGTNSAGGANNNGTVFKLTHPTKGSKWVETILYSFGTGSDGAVPLAALKFDKAGNLYGTTSAGGSYGYGTIFQLTPSGSSWTETILHNFQDADDGAVPYGGLIADKSGNFYGSATEGGTGGGGTIYKLTPESGDWTFTVLYSNPGWGISGSYRNLTLDASGNLYGTTHCDGADSAGTVYKLSEESGSWTYTSLYVFTGGTDGQYSYSNPVIEGDRVFGTTRFGGANGSGVVWEITL